ncbi:hypothetical protein ZWY2020_006106 [Hordeum vulgare]|nr:hypothetical protein ZWY2020_006106 [Hordeum vulgare]
MPRPSAQRGNGLVSKAHSASLEPAQATPPIGLKPLHPAARRSSTMPEIRGSPSFPVPATSPSECVAAKLLVTARVRGEELFVQLVLLCGSASLAA